MHDKIINGGIIVGLCCICLGLGIRIAKFVMEVK